MRSLPWDALGLWIVNADLWPQPGGDWPPPIVPMTFGSYTYAGGDSSITDTPRASAKRTSSPPKESALDQPSLTNTLRTVTPPVSAGDVSIRSSSTPVSTMGAAEVGLCLEPNPTMERQWSLSTPTPRFAQSQPDPAQRWSSRVRPGRVIGG